MNEKIKPIKGSIKKRKRVGRGNASGFGGECGRGHKGQKSRSGGGVRPGFEGGQMPLYKRLPKVRGIKNPKITHFEIVNVGEIEKRFKESDTIELKELKEVFGIKEKAKIKVLGEGQLTKKLLIKANKFSKSAIKAIEDSKSTYEIVA